MKQKALMIVFLLMLQAGARAQDKVNFAQMHLSLGYEYMFNTYSRNGSEIGFGFDYNFHKNVYASLLAHYGNYESKGDVIPSDRRQEWAVVAGYGLQYHWQRC